MPRGRLLCQRFVVAPGTLPTILLPALPPWPPPQNRLRLLRSLGLSNADVAALVRSTPDVLALPPAASAVRHGRPPLPRLLFAAQRGPILRTIPCPAASPSPAPCPLAPAI